MASLKQKTQKLLVLEVEKQFEKLSLQEVKEIFLSIYRLEPVILGIMLAEAAKFQHRIRAYINAVKLLEMAILPPNLQDEELASEFLEEIVGSLPCRTLAFIFDFMAGYLAEHQPIPFWREVSEPQNL